MGENKKVSVNLSPFDYISILLTGWVLINIGAVTFGFSDMGVVKMFAPLWMPFVSVLVASLIVLIVGGVVSSLKK